MLAPKALLSRFLFLTLPFGPLWFPGVIRGIIHGSLGSLQEVTICGTLRFCSYLSSGLSCFWVL